MDQIAKELEACMQEQHKNMLTLLAYTGLRTGELCGLKTPKTDRERTVDLMPPAIEALQSQKKLSWFYPRNEHEVELADKTIRIDNIRFVFNPKATENLNAKTP